MFPIIRLLVILLPTAASAFAQPPRPPPDHLLAVSHDMPYIARATTRLIADAYVPVSSTLRITRAATHSPESRQRQLGFVNAVVQRSGARIAFTIESVRRIRAAYRLRFFNVLFVDGYLAFRQIYAYMKESLFDYTGLYTVVLTESSRYQYDTIARILQDCWTLQIVNVVVVVSIHPRARTAVYTYYPFTQFHCEAVAPVVLNYYVTDGFMYANEFFPRKMLNLWGCPLRLATYELVPFMLLEPLPSGDRRGFRLDGIDGITARVLSQRLNFTLIVIESPEGRGQTFANGSATGAFRMLLDGETNMTIGAIGYTTARSELMTASTPYYQSPVHFAVPKGRNYTAFETLFLPFERAIWTWTLALFVATAALLALLRRTSPQRCLVFVIGAGNRTPFVNMMAVFMGAVLTDAIPVRNFARFLLMVWTLASLVLRTAYQGALFQYLQTQKMVAPVEFVDDLIAANYSLRMSPPIFSLFDGMPKVKAHLAPTDNEEYVHHFDTLVNQPSDVLDVYLTPKLAAGFYNTVHKNRTVLLSRERIFIVPVVIYFRKHSCLAMSMDTQIQFYQVAGLLQKWLTNFYDERVLRMDAEQTGLERGEHRPLRLLQVSGAFQMCAYMLMLAVLILVAEMLAPRCWLVRVLLEAL